MKKLLNVSLAVLLASALSVPAVYASPAQNESPDVVCARAGDYAELVMTKRQSNVSMSELLSKVQGKFARGVIMNAYNEPSFSSELFKKNKVKSFRNRVEMECYKYIMGK